MGAVCVCVGGGWGGDHYIRMGSRDEQTKVVLFSLIGSGGGGGYLQVWKVGGGGGGGGVNYLSLDGGYHK